MSNLRVLIAGGGTGGHLFPAIALADELSHRGATVRFVGTAQGLEARVVPGAGYELDLIQVSGLKRVGSAGVARGLLRLPGALWRSARLVRRFRPEVVVGVGGYASGPVVLAAALLRRPTAIMEQNSVPGVTNRILGRLCRRVYLALEPARRYFPARKVRLLGNPVRRAITDAAGAGRRAAPAGPPCLLVVGGSQGAHAVNVVVADAVELLWQRGHRLRLVHQAGAADVEELATRYHRLDADALAVRAFIDDMAAAYAEADLVLGRAGATTIAELCAVGRPAILVPYPFAADNHQELNARVLEDAGAAQVVLQRDLAAPQLADLVAGLLEDAATRHRMAAAMRGLGRPTAASDIADDLEELVATRRATPSVRCA